MSETTAVPAKAPEKPTEADVVHGKVLKALQHVTGMTDTEIAEVDLDANFFTALHFDELDRVELVMKIEEDLGIDITDAEEESSINLRVLMTIVKAKKTK